MTSRALKFGADVSQAAVEAVRLKKVTSEAFDGGLHMARRLAKRGRHAAEDMLDDAAHRIKREPLRSVSTCFAVGIGVGVLSGWLMTRNHHA